MSDIEWVKCVTCPDGDRFIEVDNECIGCEYYDGGDDFNHTISCKFKECAQ